MHQKSGSRIYLPRNVSLWPANGSSPLILRRLVHVEDSEKETIKKINRNLQYPRKQNHTLRSTRGPMKSGKLYPSHCKQAFINDILHYNRLMMN